MRAAVLSELSNMIVACTVARSCDATAVNASARTRCRRRIAGDAIERVDLVLVADDDGARARLRPSQQVRSRFRERPSRGRLIMSWSAAPGDTIG